MNDRRLYTRRDLHRPCKVYRPGTQTYCLAQTINVSVGGALLNVLASRPVAVGETVDLAVAWEPRTAVLAAGRSVPATVVRADPPANTPDKHQTIAVRFDQLTAAALAA